jgi:hypothetical protein
MEIGHKRAQHRMVQDTCTVNAIRHREAQDNTRGKGKVKRNPQRNQWERIFFLSKHTMKQKRKERQTGHRYENWVSKLPPWFRAAFNSFMHWDIRRNWISMRGHTATPSKTLRRINPLEAPKKLKLPRSWRKSLTALFNLSAALNVCCVA